MVNIIVVCSWHSVEDCNGLCVKPLNLYQCCRDLCSKNWNMIKSIQHCSGILNSHG